MESRAKAAPKKNAKAKAKAKAAVQPVEPKSRADEVAAACVDLKKEYMACAVSTDLPKGHKLRGDVNTSKVVLQQTMDALRELDAESMTDKAFRGKMTEVKELISQNKMLVAQAKAVLRELVPLLVLGSDIF